MTDIDRSRLQLLSVQARNLAGATYRTLLAAGASPQMASELAQSRQGQYMQEFLHQEAEKANHEQQAVTQEEAV